MTEQAEEIMKEQIIDTCCLLNLYATSEQIPILDHFGGVFVSEHVQEEALWIRCVDHESPPHLVPQEVDLTEAIDAGHITVCKLESQQEIDWFVEFAQQLDDGESSVLALAKSRGWTVATDDKKARRIAAEQGITIIGTSEMIQMWAASQGMSDKQTGEVLYRIQRFGRFQPRRSDPLCDWWTRLVSESES